MSWLFGSRKSSNKHEVFVSNEVENGFNLVSTTPREEPRYPLYPTVPSNYVPQVPYLAICPQAPPGYQPGYQPSTTIGHSEQPTNPLDSIPFKLSSKLDSSSTPISEHQLQSIKRSINSIKAGMNSHTYSYNFQLERSVLREQTTGS